MRRVVPLAALFALGWLTGCDTLDTPLLEPDAALPLIQDARDTELAGSGVYLLPPINDTDYTRTAPFDIDAEPRLEICHLDVQGELTEANIRTADCDNLFTWFETGTADAGQPVITVQPEPGQTASDSLYSVNWKTPGDSVDVAFRGTVLLPKFTFDPSQNAVVVEYEPAARFDVVLYDNSSIQLDPDSVVGFTAGKNFPIKFVVEETSGCSGLDCFAYPVTCLGGLFETDHAGVLMPEDWAPKCDDTTTGEPEFDWWLFQERLPEGSACVPDDQVTGIPYEPCYVWQLIEEVEGETGTTYQPYLEPFVQEVTVQFCAEAVKDDGLLNVSSVFRYSQTDGGPTVTQLEPGDGDILTNQVCPFVETSSSTAIGIAGLADRVVRPALALLGLEPRVLYAGDTGALSASTIRMSEFQRFVELNELEATTSLSPTVIIGGTTELGVRLTSPPHHEPYDVDPAGVGGVMIRYEVDGDATISTSTQGAESCDTGQQEQQCLLVPTSSDLVNGENVDEAGYASVVLTVGSTGTFSVNVTVPIEPDLGTLTFSVQAVDLVATFLEPLETGDFYGSPDELFTPTVLICEVDATPCTAESAHWEIPTSEIKLVEENGRKFYQADWKPKDSGGVIGTRYTAQILADGTTVGYSIPIEVTKGGKSERIEDVYFNGENSSVPLKFTITRVDPVQ